MSLPHHLRRWFGSRAYGRIGWCLPAALLGAAWLAFGLAQFVTKSNVVHQYYSRTAARALAVRDYKTAHVAYQRLLLSWQEDLLQNQYYLALSLFGLGREPEGAALLNLAAPVEKAGYAPAHLFVARYLLSQTNLTLAGIKQAEVHLNHVLEREPVSLDAHEMLGRLYFQVGKDDLASKHLLSVVAARPASALPLAMLAKRAGNEKEIWHWTEVAAAYYRDRVEKAPKDNPEDRLAWAQTLALQANYEKAIQVLDFGEDVSGSKVYAFAFAEVYGYWAAQVARDAPANLATRLKWIQKGLTYRPQDIRLLDLLLNLSQLEGLEAKMVEPPSDQGDALAMFHLLMGTSAAQHGDPAGAYRHFALVNGLDSKLLGVPNNMALLLALTKHPDLSRALAITLALIETSPSQPDFHNTRGQILVKLGKWEEAVKDLEFALPSVLDKSATQSSLAEAYRKLGNTQLAERYERLNQQSNTPALGIGDGSITP